MARIAKSVGFYVDSKEWDSVPQRRAGFYQVSAENSDIGSAEVTIPAAISEHESDVAIGLNMAYVSEFLRFSQETKGATPVRMAIKDSQSAAHFAPVEMADGHTWDYVLMPMRV